MASQSTIRVLRFCALGALLSLSAPVAGQTIIKKTSNPTEDTSSPDEEPGEDTFWPIAAESGVAVLGASASLGVGFGIAYAVAGQCIQSSYTNWLTASFGCGFEAWALQLSAWVPGGILLTPWLVDVVGDGAGEFLPAFYGSVVGLAVGAGAGVGFLAMVNPSVKGNGVALFAVPVILGNAAGAVIGYELSVGNKGKLHHRTYKEAADAGPTWSVLPLMGAGVSGLSVGGTF